jgi:L-seryl-tRNA(Ser) seleniumtransferase
MHPAVAEAMSEASQACVDMAELQAAASQVIAGITGAEAGCVAGSGAAALMLGAAACMTGLDVTRMNRLPDSDGMPNEFIMSRSQRNMYDRAVRQAGGKLVEVGVPDRFTGAGVRDAEPWHFEAAITDRTAAILWVAQRNSEPSLEALAEVAARHRLPLLVDAAGQLPPRSNLRAFISAGADLVALSGGKAIGGPQASGVLAGRRDLVQAAALQMLDHDVFPALWRPRGQLFEGLALPCLPDHGIGRPAKAGKEEIIGLLTALQLYDSQDDLAQSSAWRSRCERLLESVGEIPHLTLAITEDARRKGVYLVEATLAESALYLTALEAAGELQNADPSVRVNLSRVRDGILMLNPMCLCDEDVPIVAASLRRVLAGASPD